MPACKKHSLCVAEGIYSSELIAEALCTLFECSSYTESGYLKNFLSGHYVDIQNASSDQERRDASTALLCLLSGLPVIAVEDVCAKIFDMCKKGHLDRKMLYSALIARDELDTLNSFLKYERPHLRNAANIYQGLSGAATNIFVELFLITVCMEEHWLLLLMDHLIHLAKEANSEEVQNLLALPVFRPLWPMIFIEALENQDKIDLACLKQFAELTVKCEDCEPSIKGIAKKMEWYLSVLLWIQENSSSSKITSELNIQFSSSLAVLCKYCNISELPWNKTHTFLEKQNSNGECAVKDEVALFDAFYACTLAFDYILACLHSRHTKLCRKNDLDMKHLQHLEVVLCQLQPVSLRLKVMEKIFSLLFLRFEDFHEDICSESEEGEIETNQCLWNDTGPTANLSCTVLSSSMTSMANTVDFDRSNESKPEIPELHHSSQCSTNNKNDYELYHQKHGFVFDRFMTRDLLKVLQNGLDCSHDIGKHINVEKDQNLIFHDLSHDERKDLVKQLDCLSDKVKKAIWKLEILLGSDFMQPASLLDAHSEKISLPPWLFQNCTDDDSASDDELPHATAPNRGLRVVDMERSSESGSQSNLTNQSQGQHAKVSRRGRRRSSARVCVRGTKDNIIKRMLSSNQSFVSQCLIRGNLKVAKDVIETLELRESEIAAEVYYTEAYQKLQQKVNACAEEKNRQQKHGYQNSTLKAIQRAASAGVQASSLNKEVESLLLSESLPRLHDVKQLSDHLQLFGGSVEVQPIVSAGVDIVLILSSSLPQAAMFWNIVTKLAEELQSLPIAQTTRSRSIGFLPLLQNILQVPITILENISPSELLHRWDIPNFLTRSLRDSLQFWDTMVKNLAEFQALSTSLHSDITLFSSLVPHLELAPSSVPFRVLDGKQELQYLQDFRSYLKSLSGIANLPLSEELSAMLLKSPFELLVNVVLDMSTLPQSIEAAVSQLGISLPQILSSELCSLLPSIPLSTPYLEPACVSNHVGLWVLNTFDNIGPARHPVEAVVAILSSVCTELYHQLHVKQKLLSSEEGYLLLSDMNISQLKSLLATTWELRDLDLKLLQPGAETLAFYCNLANLMLIHCLVYYSSVKNDVCLKSLIGGCSLQQLAVLSSVAYQVGSCGILTLWEVQRLALGIHLMRPSGTKALKEYAFITDSFDPLALFVVSNGSIFSPKLKVVYPDNLEEQLQQSVKDFVQYWANRNSEQVVIPPSIHQYIQSTGQDMMVFLKDYVGEMEAVPQFKGSYCFSHNLPVIVLEYNKLPVPEKVTVDANNQTWRSNSNLCQSILEYIKSHSPIVYLVLQELLKEPSTLDDVSGSDEEALEATETSITSSIYSPSFHQYPSLDRLCKRLSISPICPIFNNNVLLYAIHSMVPYELLWKNLDILADDQDWQMIIDVLNALHEVQLKSDPMISTMMDLALLELAVDCRGTSGQSWLFCERINSPCLRARCVISESSYWPGDISIAHLKKIVRTTELESYPVLFGKARSLLHSIEVYQKIVDGCLLSLWKSWQDVKNASLRDPSSVLDQILCNGNAEICLSWLSLHNITTTHPYLITSKVVVLLLNDAQDRLLDVDGLLQSIPVKKAAQICCYALESLCKFSAVQFCVHFLSNKCFGELSDEEKDTLEIVSFGMDMIAVVSPEIQIECMPLIHYPQLIIEQLVMNVQLEAAEQMLNAIRPKLLRRKSKSPFSITALDSLLRQYAEKALEFRISQGSSTSQLSETNVLLNSLSSQSDAKDSFVPPVVPSKAEWVPNEQATVCMHCQSSIFTMFNRRHHCRRCGRVVCAQCSPQKIIVESYGNLKVRVCNACFSKTLEADVTQCSDLITNATSEGNASLPPENVWRLTHCVTFNETVRGEFAYEHAPSVSLCLSILKLHSESAACPNFLVDSCETILSYLQPQGQMPNPEVDYGFVIEMCRSLVLAAKVKCAQWGYISDEPNCDQRLSKIDLLGILVSNGCKALIPSETTNHGFRRLQTQLLEAELWELALEVSTKAGMERIGVWTSWGKSCLRAGRWKEAREKFTHCFPSSGRINKSMPDSPLLLDILQILENSPHFIDSETLKKSETMQSLNSRLVRSPAVAVLNSLASLKNISQGKFTVVPCADGALQPHVYAECCYYLQEYGSHATYLQFLIRNVDFNAAVDHTLSHSVDPQIFFESVYMTCLRRGQIIQLHSAMTAVDSSLVAWTLFLHGICAALERRRLFHTLYEVQQWSKDHVRAAMTCIRFYHFNAKSYLQLAANMNHLMRAQSHLEGALAVACVSKKSRSGQDRSNANSPVEGSESMWLQLSPKELDHHMNTLERQIELTKFLSSYEREGHTLFEAASWFPHAFAEPLALGLPTLFGNTPDRKLLAGLCLFCGKNVEEGYGIVYRIMESFSLVVEEIYEAVAVALCRSGRGSDITQLLNCIRSSGILEPMVVCDSVLMACISSTSSQTNVNGLDLLAHHISNQALKIRAYIICGQLKTAYLLAVKNDRLDDIEHILQEAERLGQTAIKKICLKRLGR